jgi:hypothetical protein
MTRKLLTVIGVSLAGAAVIGLLSARVVSAADEGTAAGGKCPAHHDKHAKCMSDLVAAVDAATKAVESGDKDTALAELKKIKDLLASIHARKPGVVNVKCPMSGKEIDPAKVPDTQVRDYNGKKVGFCCPACPPEWDKLSAAEKDAKLKPVLGACKEKCSSK